MSKACPICEKPTEQKFRPFCSLRCADIDLGKWAMGSYAIPATEEPYPDIETAEIINLQKDE